MYMKLSRGLYIDTLKKKHQVVVFCRLQCKISFSGFNQLSCMLKTQYTTHDVYRPTFCTLHLAQV
jgi:hypothetical protein